MQLLLLGVSHRTAPIELREQLDFSTTSLERALAVLTVRLPTRQAVLLSTCNRAEFYVACDDPVVARATLLEFMAEFHHLPVADIAPYVYERLDRDAAYHLFRVAAGLDSLVTGEPQILGQVKEAFAAAGRQHSTGPLLNRLFHWSFTVGKRVRSETALSAGAVSVSYAAVALAKKIFGDLKGRRVLVIGAGEMGKLTAIHLRSQGVGPITITSRSAAHAAALAQRMHATSVPWDRVAAALSNADIVITATGSRRPILSRAVVEGAVHARRTQPLFIIDIAVPRDVEPATGELEQVFLYNIDDLQAVVQENLSRRTAEMAQAEAIVVTEVERFTSWMRSRDVVPTVVALRQRFDMIRRAELRRLEPKLGALPADTRARVDEITRLIIEKLLLGPTEQLKAAADPEAVAAYSETLARLFDLTLDQVTTDDAREMPTAVGVSFAGERLTGTGTIDDPDGG